MGPFRQWPTGSGFEHFYGFIGGETNQYYPAIYEGTTPLEPPKTPEEGYHFTEDMTDKAIGWARQQKALMPDKPFFMYYAPGATHAPASRSDRVVGEVQGPIRCRLGRATRANVRAPEGVRRHTGRRGADRSSRRRSRRGMTCPTSSSRCSPARWRSTPGFLEHTDHHVGRLIDALAELRVLDDTLVFYILGDNGASAEGTINGSFNELLMMNGASAFETAESMASHVDEFGTPKAYNHYAVGWAHAMNTPYQWTKQVASHWGGTRNGTIVHWPNGFTSQGETRSQFTHVIDIAATVLDVAGLPAPSFVNGIQQMPMHGQSMRFAFDDGSAPEAHDLQYFEMFCNRGVYHQGWTAVTRHSTPWVAAAELPALDDDAWELYAPDDWTQADNIAADNPAKLAELQRLFLIEAVKYSVLPLDDRRIERFDSDLAGRPDARARQDPAALRRNGAADRELGPQPQEQIPLGHRRDRRT